MKELIYRRLNVKLYPTVKQKQPLDQNLGATRFVYNKALALSISYYKKTGKSLTSFDLIKKLPKLKQKFPWLNDCNAQSLGQSLIDLSSAYSNFFRRLKNGETPGFPKFKSKSSDNDSFRVPQHLSVDYVNGFSVTLPKVGTINCRGSKTLLQHPHKLKSITVKRKASYYYVSLLLEFKREDLPSETSKPKYEKLAIDIGITIPLVVFNGTNFNISLGKREQQKLKELETRRKRYQRHLTRKVKGSNNRNKAKQKLQRAFLRESNYRQNYTNQTAYRLVKASKVVVVEDLKIANMTRAPKKTKDGSPRKSVATKAGLNREMLRLAPGMFVARLLKVAENFHNRSIVKVNPRYTSQTCNSCGSSDSENRKSQAIFHCLSCGHKDNADLNAARNIFALA